MLVMSGLALTVLGGFLCQCAATEKVSETLLAPEVAWDEKRDVEPFRLWRSKYRTFAETRGGSRKIGSPPELQTPHVTFDVGRMFIESDLVIDCKIGQVGNSRFSLSIARPELVQRVYKGALALTAQEAGSVNVRGIWILSDNPHTGEEGYCHLAHGIRYVLFLNRMDDEERKMLSLDKYNVEIYKLNRVWHGAIRVEPEAKSSLHGEANARIISDIRYKGTRMDPMDVGGALETLATSTAEATSDSRSTMQTLLDVEIKFLDAVVNGEGRVLNPKEVRGLDGWKQLGAALVSQQLWDKLKFSDDAREHDARIVERLLFRRLVLKDIQRNFLVASKEVPEK